MKLTANLLALAVVATSTGQASAQTPSATPPAFTREDAQKNLANMRRIVTPNGIETLEQVEIGGITQWIQVRGHDTRNPILLFLHGGPGYSNIAPTWHSTRGWEEYFTVVNWDQRGAGKTYAANDPDAVRPTITKARMIADTEEIITLIRKRFGKRKIFLVGHSWGSVLGIEIAQRHPDWLHAYIGMGQSIDFKESERRGWQFTLDQAHAADDAAAAKALESVAD
ncbi:MAG: alpha/beta fold hydrolase, partial [Sphingomonadaceae bacterium]